MVAWRRRAGMAVTIVVLALVLAGCAAGANTAAGQPHAAGFWMGLWHGIISPVTFVVSLFNDRVSVYEIHNNGGWYNLGFLLGVAGPASSAGSAGRASSRSRPRKSGGE